MNRVVPRGFDEASFDSALSKFREVVGEKWVTCAESDLAHVRDLLKLTDSGPFEPSAVISPASTDQVQALVRVARGIGIPLAALMPDKSVWYNGSEPRLDGTIVVDTGAQMNRILGVNAKYGYRRRAENTR